MSFSFFNLVLKVFFFSSFIFFCPSLELLEHILSLSALLIMNYKMFWSANSPFFPTSDAQEHGLQAQSQQGQ